MSLIYDLKSKIISFFADIRFYKGGIILFGSSSYELKGPYMREILDILESGDVLLRRYSHYLGSVLIPGFFSHAAMYVGDNKVIHMLGDGVTEEDILTFMRCDDMAVLRYKDQSAINDAIANANKFKELGIDYDYDFNTENDNKFYCTEFVDACFGYPVRQFIGKKKEIMPDDFMKVGYFKKVWAKDKGK